MKEEKVIKSLKITSIVFASVLGILSIFLVLNESFALFTSSTGSVTYKLETYKIPMLETGISFRHTLSNAGYKDKITEVVLEANKDLNTIDTSIDSFDLSANQDGSIIGYMTEDENEFGMYIFHLATDSDKIYANYDSSTMFYSYSSDGVFMNLRVIENIEILDTSKVTDMTAMFSNCRNLVSIDVSHFDTSNVTCMADMFRYCTSLTTIDISGLDTSKVTDMTAMFSYCSNLVSIDLSHFNTSNVTNMQAMFVSCSSLTSLDLSHFDTSKVTAMDNMFRDCTNLTELKLNIAELGQVEEFGNMFKNVPTNVHIYLKNTTTNVDFMNTNFSRYTNITWV